AAELSLLVQPGPLQTESCLRAKFAQIFWIKLVGILHVNSLPNLQTDREIQTANSYRLVPQTFQIHLNTTERFVINRSQSKRPKIEVRVQFTIDALQFVDNERARHAQRIVVSRFQYGPILLQIGAKQQRVATMQNAANPAYEIRGFIPFKVSNVGPEEQDKCGSITFGQRRQRLKIICGISVNAQVGIRIQQRVRTFFQSRRRNIDRHEEQLASLADERFDNLARLFRAPATEFDQGFATRDRRHNFTCVGRED